ncbi:hypothetical protein GCM10025762_40370 [Haloechinothrix salitolerans]
MSVSNLVPGDAVHESEEAIGVPLEAGQRGEHRKQDLLGDVVGRMPGGRDGEPTPAVPNDGGLEVSKQPVDRVTVPGSGVGQQSITHRRAQIPVRFRHNIPA